MSMCIEVMVPKWASLVDEMKTAVESKRGYPNGLSGMYNMHVLADNYKSAHPLPLREPSI
eukprot:scaffold261147_cov17-Tisochrysis_lutea.AAC.1